MPRAAAPTGDDDERRLRGVVAGLVVLYLVFVVYGSLVPLQFVARPFGDALAAFAAIPFLRLGIGSRADWVANLLLFVPLGFLAAQLVVGDRRGAPRLIRGAALFVAGCVLAGAIEFVQLYFPQRTVSQNDILAEGLGGLIGLVLQARVGGSAMRLADALRAHEKGQPPTVRLLHAYLLALLAFNVLPLDLTISPVELYHKWREGRVVLLPFGGGPRGADAVAYAWATDFLVWVPVGLLWARSGASGIGAILLRGAAAALAVEAAQLFVYSRVTDVTDVLLGVAGCGAGGLVGMRGPRSVPAAPAGRGAGWLAVWGAWVMLVLAVFWYPFGFTTTGFSAGAAVEAMTRAPFSTYYFTSEFHATNEVLRRIAFFAPGGVALGMALTSLPGLRQARWATAVSLVALAAVAAMVETGQLFLPGKVADLTDSLLEFVGAAVGFGLVKRWRPLAGTDTLSPPAKVRSQWREPDREAIAAHGVRARVSVAVPVGTVVVLALLIGAAGRLPEVPYNLRELVAPGPAGWGAALGLAFVLYGIANLPLVLSNALPGGRFVLFPLALGAQGLVSWAVLRACVPLESLHDILGTPVLGWPWEWELIGRYVALHVALMVPIVGATLFVGVMLRPVVLRDLLLWLLATALLAWPLHQLVVASAATDNLTELMRDGGSFAASTWLASALFLSATTGSALAVVVASGGRLKFAVVAAVAAVLAYGAFTLGFEPYIVKYGRIFSALQFLLSADRSTYVSDGALLLRYVVAFAAASLGLALLQLSAWQACLRAARHAMGADAVTAGTRPAAMPAGVPAAAYPAAARIPPSARARG